MKKNYIVVALAALMVIIISACTPTVSPLVDPVSKVVLIASGQLDEEATALLHKVELDGNISADEVAVYAEMLLKLQQSRQ